MNAFSAAAAALERCVVLAETAAVATATTAAESGSSSGGSAGAGAGAGGDVAAAELPELRRRLQQYQVGGNGNSIVN